MQWNEDYSRFGEWLKAQGSTGNPLEKFHCFTGLQDALSPFPGVSVVQEFEYEGLSGIGHFQTRHTPKPLVVLLVDYVKPLNVITLPVSVGQAETDRIEVLSR